MTDGCGGQRTKPPEAEIGAETARMGQIPITRDRGRETASQGLADGFRWRMEATALGWKAYLEMARQSSREVEVLTFRIGNGGRDWSAGGVMAGGNAITKPTESAAIAEMTVVPRLVERRSWHEQVLGNALAAIGTVRERLGHVEGDILEMFYVDGFLTGEIAGELNLTVDGVFYRKRKALAWMDENLPLPE